MCQFCLEHGEGKTWYLQAKNYSNDLMSNLRGRKLVEEFYGHPETLADGRDRPSRLDKAPDFVKRVVKWRTRSLKQVHNG